MLCYMDIEYIQRFFKGNVVFRKLFGIYYIYIYILYMNIHAQTNTHTNTYLLI